MSDTRYAQIEPTTRCNFTCGFCAGRSLRQGDLPYELFERFLADNPALQHVELQGEGEPLMHPRFFDMVAACRVRGIAVSIISNGSYLGQEQVERLIALEVASVHVSMESADAEEFRAIRGGKLSKVRAGLERLITRRRELGKLRPAVGLSVTVLQRTLGAVPDIVALYRELGLDGGISLQPLQGMAVYADRYDDAMRAQLVPEETWSLYGPIARLAIAQVPVQDDVQTFYGSLFARFDPSTGSCPWLEHGAYVNIDGAVSGCCFMKDASAAFGVTGSDPHAHIAAARAALAEQLRAGTIPQPCKGCDVAGKVTGHKQRSLPVLGS